jgi:hypothetical protein
MECCQWTIHIRIRTKKEVVDMTEGGMWQIELKTFSTTNRKSVWKESILRN